MVSPNQRTCFSTTCFVVVFVGLFLSAYAPSLLGQAIDIGDRLELFADDYVIGELTGDAKKVLHKPEPKEVVFTNDAPWEGNISGNYAIFQDGDIYKMYYRGGSSFPSLKEYHAWRTSPDKKDVYPEPVTCFATSTDGVNWTRADVGIYEWEGSKKNNIVLMGDGATHNLSPFKDGNPKATPDALYKAVGGKGNPGAYKSADGLHWVKVGRTGVKEGTFDSQNLAFWDAFRGEYRFYWRINPKHVRGIRTANSKDFVTWENEQNVVYPNNPQPDDYKVAVQLYNNAIQPYFRAPHILMGFPAQYLPKGEQVQPLFMTSRDGVTFDRWNEPLIPTSAPKDRDGDRSNYMGWGMLQLPGQPDEISMYATEAYRKFGSPRLRRFVFRLDGFVSVSAGAEGGALTTKPLTFSGKNLVVNYKAREGGSLRVEILDDKGQPLKGFTLDDCDPLTGDSTNATVTWKGNSDLTSAGSAQGVRVRFALKDAEIYSMKM